MQVHFWIAFALSGIYVSAAPMGTRLAVIVAGVVVIATLVALTGVIEQRAWARRLDLARQLATVLLVGWHGAAVVPSAAAWALAGGLGALFVVLQRSHPGAAELVPAEASR